MIRSRYFGWTIEGPYRRPSLLSRICRRVGWLLGVD